ncbi:hypothetical protein T03_2902 [Trichinella britovi]|uniref:Uncharacterized protein n=1 Tax=Trichinella britovi TaxID=45882 RepID=A0A0V1D2Y3_TRIBR|nr:hypothetical protein T03_2902 [Trichinella britovi]
MVIAKAGQQATGPSVTHANEQQAERRQQQALTSLHSAGNFTSIFGTVLIYRYKAEQQFDRQVIP